MYYQHNVISLIGLSRM